MFCDVSFRRKESVRVRELGATSTLVAQGRGRAGLAVLMSLICSIVAVDERLCGVGMPHGPLNTCSSQFAVHKIHR